MTVKELKRLPNEFDFHSKYGIDNITYHAIKEGPRYVITWYSNIDLDTTCHRTTYSLHDFRRKLLDGEFIPEPIRPVATVVIKSFSNEILDIILAWMPKSQILRLYTGPWNEQYSKFLEIELTPEEAEGGNLMELMRTKYRNVIEQHNYF